MREKFLQRLMFAAILLCLVPLGVFAQKMEANIPVTAAFIAPQTHVDRLTAVEQAAADAKSSGDNAWMLTSSVLVLLMTGPGLALFYGGLVLGSHRGVLLRALLSPNPGYLVVTSPVRERAVTRRKPSGKLCQVGIS